ncbi:hypothetical protein SAMD00019534_110820 [Acytostelium subglobosum LB1]|uniref:hypothetical protein n=1 Tax=Acytostelium subglobosum LB1 TaxID=1410327 RepID=UPI000644A881|nr:hypothetical protein SAMD00019534_110820 [Acytostelium subglobosum LB1]GAM27906.1 hypothetical protein SAMD00019534_110820 [Acytostelium subglobosum LB1]|eukprot:XP_012749189.1 hypothetical protein SAMD00019534_110820 [Acytostelium subglobosum LB1]
MVLILTEADVELLANKTDWLVGIDVNEAVFREESLQHTLCPQRQIIDTMNEAATEKTMTTYFKYASVKGLGIGTKVVSVVPGNARLNKPTVPATVLLIDPVDGSSLALIGGTYLTGYRTAAGSAVAARYLAPKDSSVLSVFGAGLQARCHIEALLAVMKGITVINIHNRTVATAVALVDSLRLKYSNVRFVVVSAEEAVSSIVSESDIIVAATNSSKPLFDGRWVKPNSMVIAVGSSRPDSRELDSATVCSSTATIIVDDPGSCLVSGDIHSPLQEGVITQGDLVRLSSVVAAKGLPAGTTKKSIIVYKSAGTAIQDIGTGKMFYDLAIKSNTGVKVDL